MPLTGIDVSQHQGSVDFVKVKAAHQGFVICKCSEGQDFVDPAFTPARVKLIRAANLRLGVYHYLRARPGRTGDVEARFAVATAISRGWGRPGDIPLAVDVEETALSSVRATRLYVRQFVKEYRRLTGHRPLFYTFPFFAQTLGFGSRMSLNPLWIAHFGVKVPTIPKPWALARIHQNSSSGRVPGVLGNVDTNVVVTTLPLVPLIDPLPPLTRRQKLIRATRRARAKYLTTHADKALRVWLKRKARLGRWDKRYCLYYGVDPNVSPSVQKFITRGYARGLVVTSTTGGQHAPGSYHYQKDAQGRGRAADMGNRREYVGTPEGLRRMLAHQRHEYAIRFRTGPVELLGPDNNQCILRGAPTSLPEGSPLETMHDTHVHGAF